MSKRMACVALGIFLVSGQALPAFALDCSKASSAEDKAICTDPQALAADDAMVKAYQALAARLADSDRKMLLQSQRAWLKTRTNSCSDKKGAEQAACLKKGTDERRQYLAGAADAGPGSGGKLVPVIVQQAGGKGEYELDVTVLKYAPPASAAEKLFNAEVDKLLHDVQSTKVEDVERDLSYSYDLHLAVTFASPQFISAHFESYVFNGGVHGNSISGNINIDAAKAKILEFGDIFPNASQPKLMAECMRQILVQKTEKLEGEKIEGDELKTLHQSLAEELVKLGRWSFSPGKASIVFDAYALGAYVEGAYECEFPTDFLRPLVKAGFALP